MTLLRRLFDRGISVSVENGLLKIIPASEKEVPSYWLKKHEDKLVKEILEVSGITAYRFIGYVVREDKGHSQGRITLSFESITTGESACVHFNVSIYRDRNSRHGKTGERLPINRFRPKKGSAFCKYWRSVGLEMPRSMSEFPDVINRLKQFIFIGEVVEKNGTPRFLEKKIKTLNLYMKHIKNSLVLREYPVNSSGICREKPVNRFREGFAGNPATTRQSSETSYVQDLVRIKNGANKIKSTDPIYQSIEQWTKDYEQRVPFGRTRH